MGVISDSLNLVVRFFEQITVDDTAAGIPLNAAYLKPTSGPFAGQECQGVEITLQDNPIRYRRDGTAPSSTVGVPMSVGQSRWFEGRLNLVNFKAIRTGASSGIMNVEYFFPQR